MRLLSRVIHGPPVQRVYRNVDALCIAVRLDITEQGRNTDSTGRHRLDKLRAKQREKHHTCNNDNEVFLEINSSHDNSPDSGPDDFLEIWADRGI